MSERSWSKVVEKIVKALWSMEEGLVQTIKALYSSRTLVLFNNRG